MRDGTSYLLGEQLQRLETNQCWRECEEKQALASCWWECSVVCSLLKKKQYGGSRKYYKEKEIFLLCFIVEKLNSQEIEQSQTS